MDKLIVEAITKSPLRCSLYHFTRVQNLQAIAALNSLYSSAILSPAAANGVRRKEICATHFRGQTVVLNAHLRIAPEAMDPGTTGEQFRACLDRHVFLWPTERDCLAMAAMYFRREPDEAFAVLKFAASQLLLDHFGQIKLSKYDSGSSPRYPHRMSYRKSCSMLLPLKHFMATTALPVPTKPSEVKEILVEGALTPLNKYLQTIYCADHSQTPLIWRHLARPWADLTIL